MLVLGAAGVILVLTYTRWITRSPWLCLLAPGIGFGPIMVLGALIALGARLDAVAVACAGVTLLLVSELLLINQIPDAEADRKIGRRHLVITLGAKTASRLVAGLLLASYLLIIAAVSAFVLPPWSLLALGPLPAAIWISVRLPGTLLRPELLNRLLGINVAVLLSTLALLIIGLSL